MCQNNHLTNLNKVVILKAKLYSEYAREPII